MFSKERGREGRKERKILVAYLKEILLEVATHVAEDNHKIINHSSAFLCKEANISIYSLIMGQTIIIVI